MSISVCVGLLLFPQVSVMAEEPSDTVVAGAKVTVDLQLQSHGEIRNGGVIGNIEAPGSEEQTDDYCSFLSTRPRLNIHYDTPGLEACLSTQYSAVWGDADNGSLSVYEAWAKLKTKYFFAQIGRVALSYDDERIIGPDDWAMTALSHDVLRLGYEGHGHKLHAILAYNQNSDNIDHGGTYYTDGSQPYKTMQTAWYHYDVPTVPFGASLLFMNIGMQGGDPDNNPHTEYQQLWGTYISYKPPHWSAEASYYRQTGHAETGMKIDAWTTSVKATLSPADSYSLQSGFLYMSGDPYVVVAPIGNVGLNRHTAIRGFSALYGSHHQFYGAMDFFYIDTYINGFTPGLQDFFIGGKYSPVKRLKLEANYHYLAMATKLHDLDMTLGHEIEVQGSYNLNSFTKLSAGYSFMTGTESMERLKRASNRGSLRWAWFSLEVSPRLFTKH